MPLPIWLSRPSRLYMPKILRGVIYGNWERRLCNKTVETRAHVIGGFRLVLPRPIRSSGGCQLPRLSCPLLYSSGYPASGDIFYVPSHVREPCCLIEVKPRLLLFHKTSQGISKDITARSSDTYTAVIAFENSPVESPSFA